MATARRALDSALQALGVAADCRADLTLALSEACANAIEHARLGADYCVTVTADPELCVVEVADCGIGIADGHMLLQPVAPAATRGRGIMLIRACTDSLHLTAVEPHGLTVRFSKRLVWEPGARDLLLLPVAGGT
ncbi:ATP-binding protein [Actinoplanes sp. NPDC048791]|uniref:ATP-binding protein n=1 Tax=Actinoplanes sp. NPDC048791 TaxID=3154623 RepID=UPI0033E2413C